MLCCVLVLCRLGLGSIFHCLGGVLGGLGSTFGRLAGPWEVFGEVLRGLGRLFGRLRGVLDCLGAGLDGLEIVLGRLRPSWVV